MRSDQVRTGYPLRAADDRRVPHVVAREWPSGRRLFEYDPGAERHLGDPPERSPCT